MITKLARWSRPASGSSDDSSRPLREAAADVAKSSCMIRGPSRGWLVALGLAEGITWTAGGSASADQQASPVPTCGSPESSSSPFIILDNQKYALCATASCFVFNDVAYCRCDAKFGRSISETFTYDHGKDVCTVNKEGAANGSYVVSTYSLPPSVLKGGNQASYTCPGNSDGAYAQCDGGICYTSTQGKSFPGFDKPLAQNEIICSCPITPHRPGRVGYQIVGPYPCEASFFDNCNRTTANKTTGSTLYVGAPTGTGRLMTILLTGNNPQANECFLPRD